jgi:branched-chain amino acid transport system ATP-binding protein
MLAVRGRSCSSRLLLLDRRRSASPLVVAEVFRIVKELNQREGTAVLLVEQNARISLATATRAYVLEVGSVVFEGGSDELASRDTIRQSYLGY